MTANISNLIQLKKELFHVDIRKKEREEIFKFKRFSFLQLNICDSNSCKDDYDLFALQEAHLNKVELQEQIKDILDYLLASSNGIQMKQTTDAIIKIKYLVTKYLMLENEQDRIRSVNMNELFFYFQEKFFLKYLIEISKLDYSHDFNQGEQVLNVLCIINNLLMGNDISHYLIQEFDFITIILEQIQSKNNSIVEVSLMILGNLLYDQNLEDMNLVMSHPKLVPVFQYIITNSPGNNVSFEACYCINMMCGLISFNQLFFEKHPLIPHLFTFISQLIPDHNILSGLYSLLIFCCGRKQISFVLSNYNGLFSRLLSVLQNNCLKRDKQSNLQSSGIFKVLNYMASQDDDRICDQLTEIGIIEVCQQLLSQFDNYFVLENVTLLVSNLACSQNETTQVSLMRLIIKDLFVLRSKIEFYKVRKNILTAICNFFIVCSSHYHGYLIKLGMQSLLMLGLKDYSEKDLILVVLSCLAQLLEYQNDLVIQNSPFINDKVQANIALKNILDGIITNNLEDLYL